MIHCVQLENQTQGLGHVLLNAAFVLDFLAFDGGLVAESQISGHALTAGFLVTTQGHKAECPFCSFFRRWVSFVNQDSTPEVDQGRMSMTLAGQQAAELAQVSGVPVVSAAELRDGSGRGAHAPASDGDGGFFAGRVHSFSVQDDGHASDSFEEHYITGIELLLHTRVEGSLTNMHGGTQGDAWPAGLALLVVALEGARSHLEVHDRAVLHQSNEWCGWRFALGSLGRRSILRACFGLVND